MYFKHCAVRVWRSRSPALSPARVRSLLPRKRRAATAILAAVNIRKCSVKHAASIVIQWWVQIVISLTLKPQSTEVNCAVFKNHQGKKESIAENSNSSPVEKCDWSVGDCVVDVVDGLTVKPFHQFWAYYPKIAAVRCLCLRFPDRNAPAHGSKYAVKIEWFWGSNSVLFTIGFFYGSTIE